MNDLYFLVRLIDALHAVHPDSALRIAFHQILARKDDERYRRGYQQFLTFMALVDMYQGRRISPDLPQQTYRDMRLNAPEEVAWLLDELASIPEFEDFWERAQLDIQEVPRVDDSVELTLLKDLNAVFHLTVPPGARRGTFYGITPGVYQLGFASGQIIWEETLTREDLCWEYGAPGTPMPLAAGGGEDSDQPTRQCAILDGQLNIKVYPGRTRGQLEVEVCKP